MGQIANIVAFDGQSTPASHTFYGASVSRDKRLSEVIAEWKEAITNVPDLAQGRVTLTSKKSKAGVNVVKLRVQLPIQEVVTGANVAGYSAAPAVAHTPTIEITGFFHGRSTYAERKSLRYLVGHILMGFATTETASTTGPTAEAMDSLVMPT